MPPDPTVNTGVAALVRRDGGDLLMVQRGGRESYADGYGFWSIPGGWLEHGEHPERAAEREVLEETGLAVQCYDIAAVITNPSDDGVRWVVTIFVRCLYVGGEPRVTEPEKCPAVEWVPMSKVDRLPLFKPLRLWREVYS